MLDFPNAVDLAPPDGLRRHGEVFATFDEGTQDSGNISFGVRIGPRSYFVKTAGDPDDPRPLLGHCARVELLRNAVEVHRDGLPGAMPALHGTVDSPWGPMLVYDWVDGELLYAPAGCRDDPNHAHERFLRRDTAEIMRALDLVWQHHARLAAAGWAAIDFYDGCLLYDFGRARMWLIDLDMYQRRPVVARRGRMFGSSRFMAPEEHLDGATIDEISTVFTLGRTAAVLLAGGSLARADFRGTDAQHAVIERACQPDRASRFASVGTLIEAWRRARGTEGTPGPP